MNTVGVLEETCHLQRAVAVNRSAVDPIDMPCGPCRQTVVSWSGGLWCGGSGSPGMFPWEAVWSEVDPLLVPTNVNDTRMCAPVVSYTLIVLRLVSIQVTHLCCLINHHLW